MSSAVSALENSMYHFPCYHSWILLKTNIWWFFFMKTKLNKIKKPLQKWFHRKVCFYVMLKSVSRKVAFQNTDVSPLSSPIHSFTYVMQCSVCTLRLKTLYFVLKSVHFILISFKSVVIFNITSVDFVLISVKMTTLLKDMHIVQLSS